MTDIVIAGVVAIVVAAIYWRQHRRHGVRLQHAYLTGAQDGLDAANEHLRRQVQANYAPIKPVPKVEEEDDASRFTSRLGDVASGIFLGSMSESPASSSPDLPSFADAFSGGDSGGAGAGASWEPSSNDMALSAPVDISSASYEAPAVESLSVSDFGGGSCDAGSSADNS